mmetsp:Transcript_53323/g.114558  ORF Transcript_53323/g.114558 Transcript_53323/m.114558 type:complete len:282 (+) Transcript_53323:603-1448(+)
MATGEALCEGNLRLGGAPARLHGNLDLHRQVCFSGRLVLARITDAVVESADVAGADVAGADNAEAGGLAGIAGFAHAAIREDVLNGHDHSALESSLATLPIIMPTVVEHGFRATQVEVAQTCVGVAAVRAAANILSQTMVGHVGDAEGYGDRWELLGVHEPWGCTGRSWREGRARRGCWPRCHSRGHSHTAVSAKPGGALSGMAALHRCSGAGRQALQVAARKPERGRGPWHRERQGREQRQDGPWPARRRWQRGHRCSPRLLHCTPEESPRARARHLARL